MPNRKISRGPPELLAIIYEIADKFYMKDIDFTVTFGCDDVDDYTDGIYKVRLRGQVEGQKVRQHFVVKWHSDHEKRSAFRTAYQREILFYKQIVPKILEMQTKFKVIEGLKIKFPNCVIARAERNREAIAFTDMTQDKYMFHNRFHKLELDHVALVVKNLAKLHALSFVLEKCQPDEFEIIKKACQSDVQYSDTESMSKCMISYYKASVNVVSDLTLKKKLQDCASDIPTILNRCVMPDKFFSTICHGDCWNNNIYYKYHKSRPVDAVLVDTQLLRYASPVTDLSYYIYMSTDHQFRSKHLEQILKLYYGTLSAVLRQCRLKVDKIYPENVYNEHLKKYFVFGLIEALISMRIITAVPEEAIKLAEVKQCFCEDVSFEDKSQNYNLFVERVNGVVNDFFANGYLLDALLSK